MMDEVRDNRERMREVWSFVTDGIGMGQCRPPWKSFIKCAYCGAMLPRHYDWDTGAVDTDLDLDRTDMVRSRGRVSLICSQRCEQCGGQTIVMIDSRIVAESVMTYEYFAGIE